MDITFTFKGKTSSLSKPKRFQFNIVYLCKKNHTNINT